MPIDYDRLKNWDFPDIQHSYDRRDSQLYALAMGCGANPLDQQDLDFVYEARGPAVLPSMSVVLGYPGFWLGDPATGVNAGQVLHGEQGFVIHKPLAPSGTVIGRTRVSEVIDKGAGKGALILTTRDVIDRDSGELLATLTSTSFARGDGGFGGPAIAAPPPHPMPDGAPQASLDLPTLPQAALIYRLFGDYNPLHIDPDAASSAGFDRPILHGLCTFGVAVRGLVRMCCGNEPTRMRSVRLRFSAPVFPGETIRVETWPEGEGTAAFRAKVVERDAIVLNNGFVTFTA
ncbi:MAG: MaoC family dehydratase N-terminal domain-containing protein [Sphingomonas sp.]|uniref:MaoC/PaaZ C-terminal domain-containing protein n=1 Tax=Sphingomonas sp. TaxID=28214 RepID=UPI0025FC9707|nr:MaoC/PaaZ C-terminal domain-containing protein [Sphingomonas sp.]MBX3563522.1 MaoC family dehydratase N-terminal domain-containing protein [Sphingomonas sp.]